MMSIGFLIIGNEILSGRTGEKNLPVLARLLAEKGLLVDEVRVVRDVPEYIAESLRQMKTRYDYVFTSGGIGPTHDDVTVDGVALALEVEVEENREAAEVLAAFYQQRGLPITKSRLRMARAPVGAGILRSTFPGAPGFVADNVFICAGVPAIFERMATAAMTFLPDLPRRHSQTLRADGAESEFAERLSEVQQQWTDLDIGSYPREDENGFYCHLVFSGADVDAVTKAADEMCDYFAAARVPCRRVD